MNLKKTIFLKWDHVQAIGKFPFTKYSFTSKGLFPEGGH